jgi:hypothetical protein
VKRGKKEGKKMKSGRSSILVMVVFGFVMFSGQCANAITDDFSSDPLAGGSSWSLTGTNGSALADGTPVPAFQWSSGTLTVNYNSTQPTSRLSIPLGTTVTGSDTFSLNATFTIRSENYQADPNGYMGILNVALVNSATTGPDRTGDLSDFAVDVFDNVEVTYWPNVAFWGGPYVGPTVFGANTGSNDGFSNFASWFGLDAQEKTLPLDTPLEMTLVHDPEAKTASLTIQIVAGGTILDAVPLDLSIISPTFTVDSFAISMYNDGWTVPSPASAVATVDFASIAVTVPPPADDVVGTPAASALGLAALCVALAFTATRRSR